MHEYDILAFSDRRGPGFQIDDILAFAVAAPEPAATAHTHTHTHTLSAVRSPARGRLTEARYRGGEEEEEEEEEPIWGPLVVQL